VNELFGIVPSPLLIAIFVFGVAVTLFACLPTAWVARLIELWRRRK
jgi:hypothetical protein